MAWQLREGSDSFKMWQNTTNYRRIQIMRMGFDPKKAEWDVEVENGRGKKGFATEAKAVAFAKQKMKELDVPAKGRKMAAGTESAKIKHGKYTYNFSKVYREGGGWFYMVKRSDSKKPLGNIFQTKQDMIDHYPSIAGEIRAMKFKARR